MASTEFDAPREAEELSHHPGPRQYVVIAVILAVITAAEVAIYYVPALDDWLVPFLIVFSVLKFILVALYFMHLKFDSLIFRRLFMVGVVLAFIVFTIVLLTFFLAPETAGPGA
jgi:cytochrome c oxidase subunit IV